MLKALIKTRLQSLFTSAVKGGKKKKNSVPMMILMIVLLIYVGAVFVGMFGMLFGALAKPYHMVGVDWLYFTMTGTMAIAMMIIFSFFTTQSQLYGAKDNEMLLAMPIPPKYILFSRMLMLYIVNVLSCALVYAPAIYQYVKVADVSATGIAAMGILIILLPLLGMSIACIIGAVIQAITSRMRSKTVMTMVLSLAFFGIYFYGYSQINKYINLLISNGEAIAGKIRGAFAPAYALGAAISDGSVTQIIIVCALCVVPFIIVYAILSMTFIHIATMKKGGAKRKYVEKEMKQKSVGFALLGRELKRFAHSPIYMMNTAMGPVMIVFGAGALIIKGKSIIQMLSGEENLTTDLITGIIVLAICLMTTLCMITAASISLEGDRLWIIRTAPIKTKDILQAKINLHLTICLPAIAFADIVTIVVIGPSAKMIAMLIVLPIIMAFFVAVSGLAINLKMPKLQWSSETEVVKQSASSMVSSLGGMAMIMIPGCIYGFLLSESMQIGTFMIIIGIIYFIFTVLLYVYVMTKGCRKFEQL